MGRRGFWTVLLCGALACDTAPGSGWLSDAAPVQRESERFRWGPHDLKTPWSRGLHGVEGADGADPWIWSAGSYSALEVEVLTPGVRTLQLRGFPVPMRPSRVQTVDVTVNDRRCGRLEWGDEATRELTLTADVLVRGRNRIRLDYGVVQRPHDSDPANPDRRRLAMAWRELALLPVDGAPRPSTRETRRMRAGDLWWRWLEVGAGAALRLQGVADGAGATVLLVEDSGDGRWSTRATWDRGPSERLDIRFDLEAADAGIARLGLLVSRGAVRWTTVESTSPPATTRPPVVLVSVDTTRRDALGVYNGSAQASPAFDALAARSVVWDRALAPTPTTAPTHTGLFLSRYPADHGLTNNGRPLPRAGAALLAHQFQARGYETAAFVSIGVLAADLGFDQGFHHFDDVMSEGWWRFAAEVNRHALPWIAARPAGPGARPRFLWVHYSDPHKPYGVVDDLGRGARAQVAGGPAIAELPTHGRIVDVPLTLPPGRHQLWLTTPPSTAPTADGHLLIGHTAQVLGDVVAREWGEGWEVVHGYHRMRERASLVFSVPGVDPATFTLRLRLTDVPSVDITRERYRREVRAMDDAFAALMAQLDAAGWLADAVVMVVGDHGEDLGEDGEYGHVEHVGARLTEVPMFLAAPGLTPRRMATPVSVIDLGPTLLGHLGWLVPAAWRGEDALDPRGDRPIYLETFPPEAREHWRGVVLGSWKLAARVDGDLPPVESLDGAQVTGPVRDTLRSLWNEWAVGEAAGQSDIDPAMHERLRALGYVR